MQLQAVDSVVEFVLDKDGDKDDLSIAPVIRPRTLPDPLDSENDAFSVTFLSICFKENLRAPLFSKLNYTPV